MTQSSVTLVMIIAAISLTIGYVAGWLISSGTRSRTNDEKETTKEQALKEKMQPLSRPDLPPGNPTGSYRPVLRLWREEKGRMLVEFEGKSLVASGTLLPEQRKRLEAILRDAAVWLGLLPSATQPPAADPAVNAPAPTAAAGVPTVRSYSEPAGPAIKPPSMLDGLANVIQPITPKRDSPKTIVGQIDEVLQELLAASPLAGQKIYLAEDLRQGVIVWAGPQSYVGIDSVPAGEVKDLLKRSVAEWERRQEILRRG